MARDDAFKSSFINRKLDLEIDKLFRACVKLKASDLHLKVDKAPMVRVDGTLRPMNREPISDEEALTASCRTLEACTCQRRLKSSATTTKA
jgi:twitching motility protein PilT